MALTPGMRCSCGCGCALPKTPNARGCPCACGSCNACNSRVRASGESARTVRPGHVPVTEARSPAAPAPVAFTNAQVQALLNAVRPAAAAAPTPVAAQQPAQESAPLHTLSTDELGRRLVRAVSEGHRSPWWRAPVRENADTPALSGLAEQVQALPTGPQSVTLSEALATRYDLHSPAWTRGTRGVRTVFDA